VGERSAWSGAVAGMILQVSAVKCGRPRGVFRLPLWAFANSFYAAGETSFPQLEKRLHPHRAFGVLHRPGKWVKWIENEPFVG